MDRRRLLQSLALAFLVPSFIADAQKPTQVHRIGYLWSGDQASSAPLTEAFLQGLRELGYAEGRNILIEWRFAEGKADRLPDLAAELVRRKVDLIVAVSPEPVRAAKEATATVPIVMVAVADPVTYGFVASLARPGGNVTGISALAADYAAKSLELLKEAAPRISRVGVLGDGRNPTYETYRRQLEPAGRTLGLALEFVSIETVLDIEAAFLTMQKRGADAVLVMHQPFTYVNAQRFAEFAARHRFPAMYGSYEAVDSGGLMSYAVNVPEVFRHAAYYVDKILKGAKPADLPMEQPTRFELVINLKTAKALGLTIPATLLVRADRVVE